MDGHASPGQRIAVVIDGANFYRALRRIRVRAVDVDVAPAVDLVRRMGRKVIAASPIIGRRLREACDAAVRLDRDWFRDCLR